MSILARYRKPGGFKQLLQLIETSQPVKQAKLLEVVEKEDPSWADLIRQKKITPEMVLSWELDHLTTIFESMIPRHVAIILKNISDEKLMEFQQFFKLNKYNELKEILEHLDAPKEMEVRAAHNHMLEIVRFLDEERKISLRYINPDLDLSDAA